MAVTRLRSTASTLRLAAAATLVAVLGLTMFASTAGGATDPAPKLDSMLHYALDRPLCHDPITPGVMRCFSYKRVPVKIGTKHAYGYRTNASRGPAGGYTPRALATAYNFNPKINRSKLTVAIVLWYDAPNALSDLNTFNVKYGLNKETSASFRKVNQRGVSSPLPRADRGSAGEIALDTQAVRGACNTCKILLVEADGPYDTDLARAVNTAVRPGADVVSNSYGTPERKTSSTIVQAFNHPGVVLTASTGDDGWLGWDYANTRGERGDGVASFPSTSSNVVAVGATTLKLDSTNRRVSETVWNSNGRHNSLGSARHEPMGATGGGCSKRYTARGFMSHYSGYRDAGCSGRRLAADMSLVGDPQTGFDVYDSYGSGGWVTIGGSSLSAPLAAGMFALAGGAQGARYPASAVYGNAQAHPGTRYDVTVGGNGFCATDPPSTCSTAIYPAPVPVFPGRSRNPNKLGLGLVDCSYARGSSEQIPARPNRECTAAAGFDGPSGVGTPRGLGLFTRTDPRVTISHARVVEHGRKASFVAHLRQPLPHTSLRTLVWSWGDGKKTTTTTSTGRHTYAKKRTFTITVTAVDSRYQSVVTTSKVKVT